MAKTPPRRVTSDGKALKALANPRRARILQELGKHGQANSTTIADALGENTGTTSYHLRVLAEAGIIEEMPERASGRERWYRTVPTDRRAPEYDSLSEEDKAAYDAWARLRMPGEIALFQRLLKEYNQHGSWVQVSRGYNHYTLDEVKALTEDHIELLTKYGSPRDEAPPDARPVHTRFFTFPDTDAEAD